MLQGNDQRGWKTALTAIAAAVVLSLTASAQTVSVYGTLSNFDVVNDTGSETQGFEIEFRGVSSVNSYYNWNRYGAPQVIPIPSGGGVYVRWMAPYNSSTGRFITGTPAAIKPTAMTGHQCVIGTPGYDTSGCEHFGLTTTGNATQIIYRWLVADPANPGQLKTYGSQVAIPAPVWSVQPPVRPADPVVVVADVDPPIPPKPAKIFGDAQWMKTYKSEAGRLVNLDELIADNPVVPENEAQIETQWDLMQTELGSNSKRKQKRGGLGNGSKAVVRRFEFYKYTGAVDPVTGEALCVDGLCDAPADGEVGDFIGAQNAAVNLNVPAQYSVTVTVTGGGEVSSADRIIRCPSACSQTVNTHSQVTLTAKEGSGLFAGWTGACSGMSLTCTITVDSEATVGAKFVTPVRLKVNVNGLGTVTANPSRSSVLPGTVATLTATPAAGQTFTSWTGGCVGTALTCTLTVNTDTTVTANFSGGVAPVPTTYKLVVKTDGKGSVTSNPAGSSFASGTIVTLTAVPAAGSPWKGWTGACNGLSLTCTVTIKADTTVTAAFR